MRKIVLLILLVIGFANTVVFVDSDMMRLSSHSQIENDIDCPNHATDGAHQTLPSHQCHVGHCAFLITEFANLSYNEILEPYISFEVDSYFRSVISELFRPPIA